MLIIGEKINATRSRIGKAIEAHDAEFIGAEARRQAAAGAHMIDVNAGRDPRSEKEDLVWLIETVQEAVDLPLCIDSANPQALAEGIAACKKTPLINSATAEEERLEPTLSLGADNSAPVVALLMDDGGIPAGVEKRLEILDKIISAAGRLSIPIDHLYVDPLIQPVCTMPGDIVSVLDTVEAVRKAYPEIHIVCGLSNVSFGMPKRALLNRTFLALMMRAGLDAAIMDALEQGIVPTVLAMEVLLGRDEYCLNYISASRAGKLD